MHRLFLSLVAVFLGCLAIPPILYADDAEDHFNRGIDLYEKGEYDRAIDAFSQALRLLDPNDNALIAAANYNRGNANVKKGECDKAIADFSEAIRLNPSHALAYLNRGIAFKKKGEYDKAIADYNRALALLDPKDTNNTSIVYYNRGTAWSIKREYDKAISDYSQAVAVNPEFAFAYIGRGMAYYGKGDYDKAIADLNEAIRLDPKYVAAWNGLAWLYAICPDAKYRDGKRAVENANEAYQLTDGKDWNCIGALAAAYAESGDFDNAKEWGAKAVEMATTDKSASDTDKAKVRSCLELYKQGKPYHEELKKK